MRSSSTVLRPHIPPLLCFALALWASCAFVLSYTKELCQANGPAVCAACALLVVSLTVITWRHSTPLNIFAIAIGLCLGIMLGTFYCEQQESLVASTEGVWGNFDLVFTSDCSTGTYGANAQANAKFPDGSTHYVGVSFDNCDKLPRYGDAARVSGYCVQPSENAKTYYWQQGFEANLHVSAYTSTPNQSITGIVSSLRNAVIDAFESNNVEDGGLTLALLCGYRAKLNDELYQSFQVCGLAHIVAVSGAHLSIVVALVACLLGALHAPRRVASGAELMFVLGYLLFTAAPISALRSAVMVVLLIVARTTRRKNAPLNSLALCIGVFVFVNPISALSVSFALSALSTLGIVLFSPLISSWFQHLAMPKAITSAVALTLASTVMATPFSAAIFSKASLIALLANAIAAPLFAPVCALAMLAACTCVLPDGAAGLCVACAKMASGLFGGLVQVLACIPHASVPAAIEPPVALVVSTLLALAMYLVWPTARQILYAGSAACAACLVWLCAMYVSCAYTSEILMLDVGQGDAFLLRSQGKTILIDTGNQDALLAQALARNNVRNIDAILISHSDDDHMGALGSLKGLVAVRQVLLTRQSFDCDCDNCKALILDANNLVGSQNVVPVSISTEVHCGEFELQLLWPSEFREEGGNADSQCWSVAADVDHDARTDWSALFVGDAESEQLQELNDMGKLGHYDIYKVGHHGSKAGLTSELAQVISPKLALVSVGKNNRYGHPNKTVLDYLGSQGTKIYRTDEQGDVSCKLFSDHIEVETER